MDDLAACASCQGAASAPELPLGYVALVARPESALHHSLDRRSIAWVGTWPEPEHKSSRTEWLRCVDPLSCAQPAVVRLRSRSDEIDHRSGGASSSALLVSPPRLARGQPALWWRHPPFSRSRGSARGTNRGGIDHPGRPVDRQSHEIVIAFGVKSQAQGLEYALQRAVIAVEGEAVVDGAPLAIALGHIAPGSAGAALPEDAIARQGVRIGAWEVVVSHRWLTTTPGVLLSFRTNLS